MRDFLAVVIGRRFLEQEADITAANPRRMGGCAQCLSGIQDTGELLCAKCRGAKARAEVKAAEKAARREANRTILAELSGLDTIQP